MKFRVILIMVLVSIATFSFGQNKTVDLALAFNGNDVVIAPSFVLSKGIFNGRIAVGTGLRMSYLTSKDPLFTNESYADFAQNIYQTTLSNYKSASFNIPIYFGIRLTEKFSIGANIDVIGLTFGPEGSGQQYIKLPVNQTGGGGEVAAEVKPSSFNLLLGGARDLGTLNSEFYAQYKIHNRIGIRAGYSFLFSEVKVVDPSIEIAVDALRNKIGLGFIAVNFSLTK